MRVCVCFLAFVIRHANLIVSAPYCHLRPVWLYHNFLYYLINGTIFGKTIIEHKIRVLIFSVYLYEKILILRITWRDIITNVHRLSYKVPVSLVRF